MIKAPLIIITLVSFMITSIIGPICPVSWADEGFRLPAPGVMVRMSPPLDPPILKGIKIHPDNPFRFDFILDKGDSELSSDQLKGESSKLIKYFLASLTIPENDLWVNLSPYEKDRIIPKSFGLTEMGRDLLAEDYMLKQITASLIYPEDEIGKKFWKRIYEEAQKKFGTTNIPVNTFNKVWIVPEKAVVYENAKAGTAYVVESKLKVMLEQDYLSLEKHEGIQSGQAQVKDTNQLGSQIVREIVIPELTKEVNENKNFARLRQVYSSLILATWYKKKIKDSILEQVYADKNKVAGVNIDDPKEKERIYQRYLQAFKKGVYNYIKEDLTPDGQIVPRKYFSGGAVFAWTDKAMSITEKMSYKALILGNRAMLIKEKMDIVSDKAMGADGIKLREHNLDEQQFGKYSIDIIPANDIHLMEDYFASSIFATVDTQGDVNITPKAAYMHKEYLEKIKKDLQSQYNKLMQDLLKIDPDVQPINIVLHDGTHDLQTRIRIGTLSPFLPLSRDRNTLDYQMQNTFGFRDSQGNIHLSIDLFVKNDVAGKFWEEIERQIILSLISSKYFQGEHKKMFKEMLMHSKEFSFSDNDFYHKYPDAVSNLSLLEVTPLLLHARNTFRLNTTISIVQSLCDEIQGFGDNMAEFFNDWAPLIFPPGITENFKKFLILGHYDAELPDSKQINIALNNWEIFKTTSYFHNLIPIFDKGDQTLLPQVQHLFVSHQEIIHQLYEGKATVENSRIVFIKMESIMRVSESNILLGKEFIKALPRNSLVIIPALYYKDMFNVEGREDLVWMDFIKEGTRYQQEDDIGKFENKLRHEIKQKKITHVLIIEDHDSPINSYWQFRDNPRRNDKNPFKEMLQRVSNANTKFAIQIHLPNENNSLHAVYAAKHFSAIQAPYPADLSAMPISTSSGETRVYGHYPDGIIAISDDHDGPDEGDVENMPDMAPDNGLGKKIFKGIPVTAGDRAMNAVEKKTMSRNALIEVLRDQGWNWYQVKLDLMKGDQHKKFLTMIEIAGLTKDVRWIEEAKKSEFFKSESKYPGPSSLNWLKICEAFLSLGKVEEAKVVVMNISDSHRQVEAWIEIVKVLTGLGRIEEAKTITQERIKVTRGFESKIHLLAWVEIAKALARLGKIEEAKKMISAELKDDAYFCSLVWIEIFKFTKGAEGLEQAKISLSRVDYKFHRDEGWTEMAKALIVLGRMQEAKDIVSEELKNDPYHCYLVWMEIAKANDSSENIKHLNGFIQQLNVSLKISASIEMASFTKNIKYLEKAKELTSQRTQGERYNYFSDWVKIVKVLANLGNVVEAKKAAILTRFSEHGQQSLAWVEIQIAQENRVLERYNKYDENEIIQEFKEMPKQWDMLKRQELKMLLIYHSELMKNKEDFKKAIDILEKSKSLIDSIESWSIALGDGKVSESLYESWMSAIAQMALEFYSRDSSDRWHSILVKSFQDGRYQSFDYQKAIAAHQEILGRPSFELNTKLVSHGRIMNVRWGVLVREITEHDWERSKDKPYTFETNADQNRDSQKRKIPFIILVKGYKEINEELGLTTGKIVWNDIEEPLYLVPDELQKPRELNGATVRVLGFSTDYSRVYYEFEGEIVSSCLNLEESKKLLIAHYKDFESLNILPTEDGIFEGDVTYRFERMSKIERFTKQNKFLEATLLVAMTGAPTAINGHYESLQILAELIKQGKAKPDSAQLSLTKLTSKLRENSSIKSRITKNGGVDLTAVNLQTHNNGGEIKFHMNPAMLTQLQNAPGFVPVIINIQPLNNLPAFLGINTTGNVPVNS